MPQTTTANSARPVVVFDGGCAYCRRQARRIDRLDWCNRLDTITYDEAIEYWPEVARGKLGDGLRVRFPNASVTVGIDAVRSIAIRMPLTVLPATLLWIPGLRHLGAWAYAQVARRRQRDADAATCAR